jgi:hypothetical protein
MKAGIQIRAESRVLGWCIDARHVVFLGQDTIPGSSGVI